MALRSPGPLELSRRESGEERTSMSRPPRITEGSKLGKKGWFCKRGKKNSLPISFYGLFFFFKRWPLLSYFTAGFETELGKSLET